MPVRENLHDHLVQSLLRRIERSFDLRSEPPKMGYASSWGSEAELWPSINDPDADRRHEALACALRDLPLLTAKARVYVTPWLMMERFPNSDDYGAPADRLFLLGSEEEWLAIYSPLQL